MALTIHFFSGAPLTWHMGDLSPSRTLSNKKMMDVYCVEADGDELDEIVSNFRSLPLRTNHDAVVPYPPGTVMRYYGDYARFITGNI